MINIYPAIGLFFCHNKWVEINCCFIMTVSLTGTTIEVSMGFLV